MKSLFLMLLLIPLALVANAQKIATKKNLITVNGQPYARFERGANSEYYISSLQNERLFVVKPLQFYDGISSPVSTYYVQFVFTASQTFVETPLPVGNFSLLSPGAVARMIYSARLLKDGTLDPQAVADFATNHGTPYSARSKALSQPVIVVPPGR